MMELILYQEQSLRLGFFIGLLLLFAMLEALFPKKQRVFGRAIRWFSNIGIVVISGLLVRVCLPLLPVAWATQVQAQGRGLLSYFEASLWLEIVLAVILLDLIVYLQHIAFHKFPFLWRMHKVHHSDRDLDVTSGNRFHPFEILISVGVKLVAVSLIGPSAVAVVLFEIILNGMAQFNHSNLRLPKTLDRYLRFLFVTPDMHRVHHSEIRSETDSNYGFNFSIWDRLCRTYVAQPQDGHQDMVIGLPEYPKTSKLGLVSLLLLPFRRNL